MPREQGGKPDAAHEARGGERGESLHELPHAVPAGAGDRTRDPLRTLRPHDLDPSARVRFVAGADECVQGLPRRPQERALDAQVRTWYGTLAPHDSAVAGVARERRREPRRRLAAGTTRVTRRRCSPGSRASWRRSYGRCVGLEPELSAGFARLPVTRTWTCAPRRSPHFTSPGATIRGRGNFSAERCDVLVRTTLPFAPGGPSCSAFSRTVCWHGEPAAAVTTYRKAIEITPRAPRCICTWVWRRRRRETADAIASYQRSLSLDAQQPLVLVNLGIALEASGDAAGAEPAYRRAIAVDPNEPLAHTSTSGTSTSSAATRGRDSPVRARDVARPVALDGVLLPGRRVRAHRCAAARARRGAARVGVRCWERRGEECGGEARAGARGCGHATSYSSASGSAIVARSTPR